MRNYEEKYWEAQRTIDAITDTDVQPVKHGRWKDGDSSQICTICGGWGLDSFDYCPHCGARMDLGDEKNE